MGGATPAAANSAREALEIGARNDVQFAVRRHLGKLQEFSRSDSKLKSRTISIRTGSSSNNPERCTDAWDAGGSRNVACLSAGGAALSPPLRARARQRLKY